MEKEKVVWSMGSWQRGGRDTGMPSRRARINLFCEKIIYLFHPMFFVI